MEMTPKLVEGLAEEFPKLRRLGNERSYEDETAAYRNNTRQMQEQVRGRRELGAFTEVSAFNAFTPRPPFFSSFVCTLHIRDLCVGDARSSFAAFTDL